MDASCFVSEAGLGGIRRRDLGRVGTLTSSVANTSRLTYMSMTRGIDMPLPPSLPDHPFVVTELKSLKERTGSLWHDAY